MRRMITCTRAPAFAALLGLGLSACGTTPQTNPNLEAARSQVSSVSQDPVVAQQAPLELSKARESLERAQAIWQDGADPAQVNHEAYIAMQQAAIAREVATTRATQEQIRMAETERTKTLLSGRTEQTRRLEQELADLQARQTPRGPVLTLGDVLFRVNSADLLPGAGTNLDRIATFMQQHPEYRLLVEGHTDSTGNSDYNMTLSQMRADSVRQALTVRGVDPSRIETQGFGETLPVASNETAQGRQLNRRVEVLVQGPGLQTPGAAGAPR